jgi:hypothetical protein
MVDFAFTEAQQEFAQHANETIKATWLPGMARGDQIVAIAVTEAGGGSVAAGQIRRGLLSHRRTCHAAGSSPLALLPCPVVARSGGYRMRNRRLW